MPLMKLFKEDCNCVALFQYQLPSFQHSKLDVGASTFQRDMFSCSCESSITCARVNRQTGWVTVYSTAYSCTVCYPHHVLPFSQSIVKHWYGEI